MRLALVLGMTLLCFACGDDDEASGDGGGDDDAVTWHCTCWSEREDGSRSEEEILRCSADDPTDMLSDRASAAAEDRGWTGGCDQCEAGDEGCVLEE